MMVAVAAAAANTDSVPGPVYRQTPTWIVSFNPLKTLGKNF